MENRIYDEKNGLWYEQQGDYYIPCLKLDEEEQHPIGVWGQRHKQHLKEHQKGFYTALLISGNMNRYLADVDRQAQALFSRIVDELAEEEGVTERLKAENQMAWVGRMNNIRARAREVVGGEIVYAMSVRNDVIQSKDHIPKIFWKYYDLYRRNRIDLAEFSKLTRLPKDRLLHLLDII